MSRFQHAALRTREQRYFLNVILKGAVVADGEPERRIRGDERVH